MKIDQLKVLQAVIETGSVKAAAEKLNKTQPAISQSLKTMEYQTGTIMFDRSGYRLELTPLGKRVYLQSLRVLEEADDLAQLVKHFEKGNEEQLVIAMDANADIACMMPALEYLQKNFPETRVTLSTEILSGAIDAIKNEKADIGIAPIPAVLLEDLGFEYKSITTSILRNVAAPKLLESLTINSRISDLKRLHQILISDSGGSEGFFDREFGVQKGQRRWNVSNHQVKKGLLVAGLGWGRMPEHLIRDELMQGDLTEIDLDNSHHKIDLEIYAFRASTLSSGPVASSLWERFSS